MTFVITRPIGIFFGRLTYWDTRWAQKPVLSRAHNSTCRGEKKTFRRPLIGAYNSIYMSSGGPSWLKFTIWFWKNCRRCGSSPHQLVALVSLSSVDRPIQTDLCTNHSCLTHGQANRLAIFKNLAIHTKHWQLIEESDATFGAHCIFCTEWSNGETIKCKKMQQHQQLISIGKA